MESKLAVNSFKKDENSKSYGRKFKTKGVFSHL
ncbi:hypothetical protein N824_26300 [Pedobacter sp. V48]|jgi:hypothetical protein|nr:hypothetical protein N824_26300 [Pedobacter sp. V48]